MYSEIYLVDRMELTNLMHQVLIRRLGLEDKVKSFTDPEAALDDLRFNLSNTDPRLILLNSNMPVMSGFEFLEFMELEDFPSNIDVIITNSNFCHNDRFLAERFPKYVTKFVTKPLKMGNLREITESVYCA